MVQIAQVHLVGGDRHEHIASVRWRNPQTDSTGESSRAEMAAWLKKPDARAIVSDGIRMVEIGIVEASPEYIRTYADGVWTDNLLALPRY